MTRIYKSLFLAIFAILTPQAYADQGSLTNSGGSASGGSGVVINSTVAAPAGTLSINCPPTTTGACAGGSFTFLSNDGSASIRASFTSGAYAESCSGGGKGGHVTCGYSFTGYFSGAWTVNGSAQAVNGATYQGFPVGGAPSGTTGYNSAYTPFYYSDSEQILRSDDLMGTNQIAYGSQGGGVGQFYGAYGIAVDHTGRIYVADTYNSRIVRIDDMNGTNWTTYGTYGSGQGQFSDPSGIAVDPAGKIYVMDTGNARLVRMDDMNGDNWVSFGSAGSGVGQLSSFTSVAVDSLGRIYVPDGGNKRLVRMDDMTGANFTVLTQSPVINGYIYSFYAPAAVAVDSAGKIYVADDGSYAPEVVRVNDMTGANWTSLYVSPTGSTGLNSISVDSSGTAFAGGGGAKIVDNMAAVLNSSGTIGPVGSYYVFGVTPVPLPSPRPSAISLSPVTLAFPNQNVGSSGASQSVTVSNFGGSPLNFSNISTSGGFIDTTNCPKSLIAGSSCTVSVSFAPAAAGPAKGLLTLADDSYNLGATQTVTLTGLGTAPSASVTPSTLAFPAQALNTTSGVKSVVVRDTGTGPLQVASVTATAPFSQTNNCTASIAPLASCTIQVSFKPTAAGPASGILTITDNAGTQTVSLTGTGGSPVTLSASSLSFGTVVIGSTSAAKTVTLTSHEAISLNFSGIVASAGFAVASNTCGASIAAGATCTVGVTFSPTATGSATGTLTFTDDAENSSQIVSLTGTGRR